MPNLLVDMDSQRRSACYPRRTFYPFSNGPSIRNRWITNSCFRNCSTCLSHSKAPLCVYAQPTISMRLEGTFECLRYSLGGDHPSQTAHHTMSFIQIYGIKLDIQNNKSGISNFDSTKASASASQSPTYPTHIISNINVKLQ